MKSEKMRLRRFFITGTDTGVGKTTFACALLNYFSNAGFSALGLKPVASGCEMTAMGLRSEDALLLQQYSVPVAYESINPVALALPVSPHIAAVQKNAQLKVSLLLEKCLTTLNEVDAEVVIVEGAGGWFCPLNDEETMADFALSMNYPVILVVQIKLGCLNHALLSAKAIVASGLTLAGWVANLSDHNMLFAEENIAYLQAHVPAPLLARIDSNKSLLMLDSNLLQV